MIPIESGILAIGSVLLSNHHLQMASTNAGDEIEAVVESEARKDELLEQDNAKASDCRDDSSEISAVAMFDQLIANRGVLTTCEAERHFSTF